jgi:hypothetical protein
MNLFAELKNLLSRLDSTGIDYALCGGLAMAVYSYPRSTLDIDLLIEASNLESVQKIAVDLGFQLDAGLIPLSGGDIQLYRNTKFDNESRIPLALDLILVTEPIRTVWKARKRMEWDAGILTVVSAEGLITLKSMRNSGQDQDDIQFLRNLLHEG